MNDKDMLTIEEVESEFSLKRSTLYRYVRLGSITPYRKAGDRRSYFKRAEIEGLVGFHPRKPKAIKA
ncbi:helix-turn-helix domain-containing protein [Dehalogenimonas sp. 4OHTPN]|uniref:Helix-turn-helix domain-containing protein n=1 Tax=Dehalogenimonas sp. 4OHTPN TaxID=3166643 RepID=A0AAU8GBZ3_9CHLR